MIYNEDELPIFYKKEECELFTKNVIERSKFEYKSLEKYINKFNKDKNIDNIIIITHTVPLSMLCSGDYSILGTSRAIDLIQNNNNKKIKYWIYGHTHDNPIDININGIKFISNPRGRPEDYNRIIYKTKEIEIN